MFVIMILKSWGASETADVQDPIFCATALAMLANVTGSCKEKIKDLWTKFIYNLTATTKQLGQTVEICRSAH